MQRVVKKLSKHLMDYCITYQDLLDAELNHTSMDSIKTTIQYVAAERAFEEAKASLKRRLDGSMTIKQFLEGFSSMIQEVYDDPSDPE